jgi:hypothetical protein
MLFHDDTLYGIAVFALSQVQHGGRAINSDRERTDPTKLDRPVFVPVDRP